jgi:hypothetical protein
LSPIVTTIDLRQASTATWGTDARRTSGSAMVLWTGNVVMNNALRYTGASNDRDPILQAIGGSVPTGILSGYVTTDVNLDGLTKYTGASNDRDPILLNIGGSAPTSIRLEQLP